MILLYVQSAVHTVLYNVIPPGVGGLIYVIINVKALQRERDNLHGSEQLESKLLKIKLIKLLTISKKDFFCSDVMRYINQNIIVGQLCEAIKHNVLLYR